MTGALSWVYQTTVTVLVIPKGLGDAVTNELPYEKANNVVSEQV